MVPSTNTTTTNSPGESDTITLKKSERRCTLFKNRQVTFIIKFMILIVSLAICCVALGISAGHLHSISSKLKTTKICRTIGTAVVASAQEPLLLSSNIPCADACTQLTEALDTLHKEKSIRSVIDQVQALVDEGRQGITDTDSISSWVAYNSANLLLLRTIHGLFFDLADSALSAQTGFMCFIEQVLLLFFHFTALSEPILENWDITTYQRYLGTSPTTWAYPQCGALSSAMDDAKITNIAKQGPTLLTEPELSFANISGISDTELFYNSMEHISRTTDTLGDDIVSYWESRKRDLTAVVVLSSFCSAMILLYIILMPLCIEPSTFQQKEKEVLESFIQVESKAKLISQYAQYILSLKEDEHLQSFLRGSFLEKIEGFVLRVRPYIAQTCFGDIEALVLSGTGETSQFRADEAGGISADDEQMSQELRSEVGLQVAFGIFMCISMEPRGRPQNKDGLRTRAARMRRVITTVETIANSRRGMIHTVAGDYIFVTWNVTSSCLTSEFNAISTAMEVLRALGPEYEKMSISITRSTVVAGNVEQFDQREALIFGPAVERCEKLELLNLYHGTSIMVDEGIASKAASFTIPGIEFCVVPVSIMRAHSEQDSPLSRLKETAFAVYPTRLGERHKAWMQLFKEFPAMIAAGREEDLIQLLEEYRSTYSADKKQHNGKHQSSKSDNTKSIDFWVMVLKKIQQNPQVRELFGA